MLARWSPFNDSSLSMTPFMDAESIFKDLGLPNFFSDSGPLSMQADVSETEDAFEIRVDMPGVKGEDIDLRVEGDTLTIQTERKAEHEEKKKNFVRKERSYGMSARSFVLDGMDPNAVEANLKDGVLTVSVKKRDEVKPRKIQIKSESRQIAASTDSAK